MIRTILIYGLISGLVSITGILISMFAGGSGGGHHSSVWLGYLIMLVALSSIFIAIKQHRDQALGGVIKFLPAFGLGLGITVLASLAYVLVWEAYTAISGYNFVADYTAGILEQKRAAGVTGAEYAKVVAEMDEMARNYGNPLFRLPMIFSEIFPVGFLVSLVSAALLRFPNILPAKARAVAA